MELSRIGGRVATWESSLLGCCTGGPLVGHRVLLAKRGVSPVWAVPVFDESEDGGPGLGRRAEAPPVQQLALERGKEALGHRIVVAVAHAAEAMDELLRSQQT